MPEIDPNTDDGLRKFAERYRTVRRETGKPTTALANEYGVSHATARRWAARAVEAGYLTQAERTNRGLPCCRVCGRPKQA